MTDPDKDDAGDTLHAPARLPPAAALIGGICILIELVLQAANLGLVGSSLWRSLAYQTGAFWPGLLHGWRPNYPAQPVTMFITYAFLHGGFWHLAGNMLALAALGRIVAEHAGQRAFVLIYAVSALGGAAAFGMMAQGPQPMVGASGALFGLAGALQYLTYADSGRSRRRVWRLIGGAGFLVFLNAVLWFLLDGALAWQTHLGGFLSGWVTALMLRRWFKKQRG